MIYFMEWIEHYLFNSMVKNNLNVAWDASNGLIASAAVASETVVCN